MECLYGIKLDSEWCINAPSLSEASGFMWRMRHSELEVSTNKNPLVYAEAERSMRLEGEFSNLSALARCSVAQLHSSWRT